MNKLIEMISKVFTLFPTAIFGSLRESIEKEETKEVPQLGKTALVSRQQDAIKRDLDDILQNVRFDQIGEDFLAYGDYILWPGNNINLKINLNGYPQEAPHFYVENLDTFLPKYSPNVPVHIEKDRRLKLSSMIENVVTELYKLQPWHQMLPRVLNSCEAAFVKELHRAGSFEKIIDDTRRFVEFSGDIHWHGANLKLNIELPADFPISPPKVYFSDDKGNPFADRNGSKYTDYHQHLTIPWNGNKSITAVIKASEIEFGKSFRMSVQPTGIPSDEVNPIIDDIRTVLVDVEHTNDRLKGLVVRGKHRIWAGVELKYRIEIALSAASPPLIYLENATDFFPNLSPTNPISFPFTHGSNVSVQLLQLYEALLSEQAWYDSFPKILKDCNLDFRRIFIQDERYKLVLNQQERKLSVNGDITLVGIRIGLILCLPKLFPLSQPQIVVPPVRGHRFPLPETSDGFLAYYDFMRVPWQKEKSLNNVMDAVQKCLNQEIHLWRRT